ncbi:hypothetical protein EBO34_00285 [Alteribacter keqinensis]|uniref:Uncharacterized protein n=1 Tax=Alteribacter keqinensis TaxID=2483800 RepID=A0A3M7TTB3_9BACI|nr:hypothetical protein EBO34_00285 [Alteribacter keqinensis]
MVGGPVNRISKKFRGQTPELFPSFFVTSKGVRQWLRSLLVQQEKPVRAGLLKEGSGLPHCFRGGAIRYNATLWLPLF